jgi:hypothetical protein
LGGKHTSFDNLIKAVPGHLRGAAKDAAKELIKDGLILSHPTSYGLQVALNPRRSTEIETIVTQLNNTNSTGNAR